MNPMPNNPNVAMVAYTLASSNAGGPAALESSLPPMPVNTVDPSSVALAALLEAVAVAVVRLYFLGSVAPQG